MVVKIPVRPHIKKFLDHRYPHSPVKLTDNNAVGSHLIHLMRRPRKQSEYKYKLSNMSEEWPVEVSRNLLFEVGCRNLSSKVVVQFHQFMDSLFKEQLYTFLNQIDHFGIPSAKKGIFFFMEIYDLQEGVDHNYEALKKAYYKYRQDPDRMRF